MRISSRLLRGIRAEAAWVAVLPLVFSACGTYYYEVPIEVPIDAKLDLSGVSGAFGVQWLDPRRGGPLREGATRNVRGGRTVALGSKGHHGHRPVLATHGKLHTRLQLLLRHPHPPIRCVSFRAVAGA